MPDFRRFIRLAAFCGALGLTSCSCPDAEPPPPQVCLFFSTDTLNGGPGFRRGEVRSAYLVRYKNANFTEVADTFPTPASRRLGENLIAYQDPKKGPMCIVSEWVMEGAPRYGGYGARSFRLVVPAAARSYALSNIVVKTSHTDERCPQRIIDAHDITINGQVVDVRNGTTLTK